MFAMTEAGHASVSNHAIVGLVSVKPSKQKALFPVPRACISCVRLWLSS